MKLSDLSRASCAGGTLSSMRILWMQIRIQSLLPRDWNR